MKIIIKTLKGQQLPLEVEEDMKVSDSAFIQEVTLNFKPDVLIDYSCIDFRFERKN